MAYLMLLHAQRGLRRERIFRDRSQPLELYDDVDMFKRYRFNRAGVIFLIDRLGRHLEHATRRNHAVPANLQVFIALRFYATGSVLDNSAAQHGVSLPTTCRIVRSVTRVLCQQKNEFITFPTAPHKLREQQVKFHQIAGFPKVVGAIDGTHIHLHGAPLGRHEYLYTNRKGRYSINVQLICDADYKIINVVARWPGSTHDSRVLQNSMVGQNFANGRLHGILLGDSGYALHPWLMTPILNPQNQAQRAYNQSHCRTRCVIEQVNGQLKNKFRCLIGQGLQMRPDRAADVIMACAVLHNVSKQLRQPEVIFDVAANDEVVEPVEHAPNGAEARNAIIENHFS